MKPYPIPTRIGFFWAKLVHPRKMPAGEDWASVNWEVVEVIENGGLHTEDLAVAVNGISPIQWLDAFIWGPEVIKPEELS